MHLTELHSIQKKTPLKVLMKKHDILSKSSYLGKTQKLSLSQKLSVSFLDIIELFFNSIFECGYPEFCIISVNTVFSPSSDIFIFLFIPLATCFLICFILMLIFIFSLNLWCCRSYIIQIETFFFFQNYRIPQLLPRPWGQISNTFQLLKEKGALVMMDKNICHPRLPNYT